jgi:redox-regulated HSP33 family molecular chaperone
MIADGKPVNLHCDFCGKDYEFDVEELKLIDANI